MSNGNDSLPDIFQADGRLRPDLLTEPAQAALKESLRQARDTRWESVRSPHVFMGLLAVPDDGVRHWGERLEEDLSSIRGEPLADDLGSILGQFQELFRQDEVEAEPVLILNREFLSDNVIRLLRDAYQRAASNQREQITPMDLLISLLTAPNSIVAECFESMGLTAAKLTELAVIAEHHARPD